jgi:uncharacterized membrane protein YcaP (DUF421 family)
MPKSTYFDLCRRRPQYKIIYDQEIISIAVVIINLTNDWFEIQRHQQKYTALNDRPVGPTFLYSVAYFGQMT